MTDFYSCPGAGEFEIFSYVLSGQLEDRDSMQNLEVMKRGDLQSVFSLEVFHRHDCTDDGTMQWWVNSYLDLSRLLTNSEHRPAQAQVSHTPNTSELASTFFCAG